jgi:hypothetical protein
MGRVTPENITASTLDRDGVFVFGSNEIGQHGAGAARLAYDHFGARLNQGFGMMGQCFGIPTKDWDVKVLGLKEIEFYVKRFIVFTQTPRLHKWKWYVTKIGCGLAGYTPEDIAPMFRECLKLKNIWLPQDFIDVLEPEKVK